MFKGIEIGFLDNTSNIYFKISEEGKGEEEEINNVLKTSKSLAIGTWNHIAVIYEEATGKLYLNGELISRYVFSIKLNEGDRNSNFIGMSKYHTNIDAIIDDLKIIQEISSNDILNEYKYGSYLDDRTFVQNNKGLVQYFTFDIFKILHFLTQP